LKSNLLIAWFDKMKINGKVALGTLVVAYISKIGIVFLQTRFNLVENPDDTSRFLSWVFLVNQRTVYTILLAVCFMPFMLPNPAFRPMTNLLSS